MIKKGVESYAEAEKDGARVVVAVDLGVENLTSASWGSDPKKAKQREAPSSTSSTTTSSTSTSSISKADQIVEGGDNKAKA